MKKLLYLLLLTLYSFQTHANPTRCDCSKPVGECLSSVAIKSGWIITRSNVTQCSRVDYYIDGEPKVTVVTDGSESEQWLGRSKHPKIAVESCVICSDKQMASATIPQATLVGTWCRNYEYGSGGVITHKKNTTHLTTAGGHSTTKAWTSYGSMGIPNTIHDTLTSNFSYSCNSELTQCGQWHLINQNQASLFRAAFTSQYPDGRPLPIAEKTFYYNRCQ